MFKKFSNLFGQGNDEEEKSWQSDDQFDSVDEDDDNDDIDDDDDDIDDDDDDDDDDEPTPEYAAYGHTKHDPNNSLLQPIHGVTLEDYAAISYLLGTGADLNVLLQKMGIDVAVYQEVQTLWGKRMQEDMTFTVATLFGQYYNTADKHPKLNAVAATSSDKGKGTIEKMKTDRLFYLDAQAGVSAAYEYGIDGAQWLKENYDITNAELQKVGAYYADIDSKKSDYKEMKKFGDYLGDKIEAFKQKFAEEQGGNVADDITF